MQAPQNPGKSQNLADSGPLELYVGPGGKNVHPGTLAEPLRTITYAIEKRNAAVVHLLPGAYAEKELLITQPVKIVGDLSGSSTISGHVFINAPGVELSHIYVVEGVALNMAEDIVIDSSTIAAGAKDEALSIVSSQAQLSHLLLLGGPEAALQITTSSVSAESLEVRGQELCKYGIRIESGDLRAKNSTVSAMGVASIQVGLKAQLTLSQSLLKDAAVTGLAALSQSQVELRSTTIQNAGKIALSGQNSGIEIVSSTLTASREHTLKVLGGKTELSRSYLEASLEGAIWVDRHRQAIPKLDVIGSTISHPSRTAIVHRAGPLKIQDSYFFTGKDSQVSEQNPAILSEGIDSKLDVSRSNFVSSPGSAIVLRNEAHGVVRSSTISGPGTNGILIEGQSLDPILLEDLRVQDCRQGSAVKILQSRTTVARKLHLSGCFNAGILIGEESEARVEASLASDNGKYGFAAFGGALLTLQGSQARGSKWASFASCGDNAHVVDEGANLLRGATCNCP